jgi:hypothetical protein
MKTKIDPSMRIPPRAPRLPRDHFYPKFSYKQKFIAWMVAIAVLLAISAVWNQ